MSDSFHIRAGPTALRLLSKAEVTLGALLVAVLFLMMLIQTAQRYLPGSGLVWTGELARFSLVWLTFAMAGYLMGRDEHVALKLVDNIGRGVFSRLVGIFANVMVVIVCLNLTYEAFHLVTRPAIQTTPALGIPVNTVYIIPLVGLLLTTLRSIIAVFRPTIDVDSRTESGVEPGNARNGESADTKHTHTVARGKDQTA